MWHVHIFSRKKILIQTYPHPVRMMYPAGIFNTSLFFNMNKEKDRRPKQKQSTVQW